MCVQRLISCLSKYPYRWCPYELVLFWGEFPLHFQPPQCWAQCNLRNLCLRGFSLLWFLDSVLISASWNISSEYGLVVLVWTDCCRPKFCIDQVQLYSLKGYQPRWQQHKFDKLTFGNMAERKSKSKCKQSPKVSLKTRETELWYPNEITTAAKGSHFQSSEKDADDQRSFDCI